MWGQLKWLFSAQKSKFAGAYNQTLSKTIKKLEDTINENVIIARESENYVLEQEKSIQQQKKSIDDKKIETIFEEFDLRFNND